MDIIERIAAELEIGANEVFRIAMSAGSQYRPVQIGRAGHKVRLVYQPSTTLRLIQRWCAEKLFIRLPVHHSCFSYVRQRNIVMHARMHSQNNYLARVDIQKFFPSLSQRNVLDLLNKFRDQLELESKRETWLISLIVTRSGSLVIGAPSSPSLSNALMFDFDEKWFSICTGQAVTYTRYADDMYLSTRSPNVLSPLVTALKKDLEAQPDLRLQVNQEKDIFTSRKRLRRVTGIVLTPEGQTSIGRDKKRIVKGRIHRALESQLSREEVQRLLGMLAYIDYAEPNFASSLRAKYGADFRDKLAALAKVSG